MHVPFTAALWDLVLKQLWICDPQGLSLYELHAGVASKTGWLGAINDQRREAATPTYRYFSKGVGVAWVATAWRALHCLGWNLPVLLTRGYSVTAVS